MRRALAVLAVLLLAGCDPAQPRPNGDQLLDLVPESVFGPFPLIGPPEHEHGWIMMGSPLRDHVLEDLRAFVDRLQDEGVDLHPTVDGEACTEDWGNTEPGAIGLVCDITGRIDGGSVRITAASARAGTNSVGPYLYVAFDTDVDAAMGDGDVELPSSMPKEGGMELVRGQRRVGGLSSGSDRWLTLTGQTPFGGWGMLGQDCLDEILQTHDAPHAAARRVVRDADDSSDPVTVHDRTFRDRPAAYITYSPDAGAPLMTYNAVATDDGSLVLVSNCGEE